MGESGGRKGIAMGFDSDSDSCFAVGTKVEARYKGRDKFYPGVITRVRSNGTYNINYDNGEQELYVTRDFIRIVGTHRSRTPERSGRGGTDGSYGREGQKVWARYHGREKYYPGIIARDRADGTYDIEFDEGMRE